MLLLAWLLIGSGGFLSWSAVRNRNPVATLVGWLSGKPAPDVAWHAPLVYVEGAGSAVGNAGGEGISGAIRYKGLGVTSNVQGAAEHFGSKYRIRTILGKGSRPGNPSSDHPKGLALDFMTASKATGDALAADAVANAASFGVTYVIWWFRIWTPDKGWHTYTGTPNPHTDHVHVSFSH